ncbi:MAG: haloalkane dehalogenase [Gammaproteobacteria bacterium]|nr:haloalkane dehalogenase [Gammaproteobacteria bacterium]
MNTTETIPNDFPFHSKYAEVLGSKMHYVDEGSGDPILFLHGMPTSSYLWRNVIPWVKSSGRCIALDLIGMGQSDQPNISYQVFDHVRYIEAFIEKLGLKNITLVMHGWGSVIGFDYAMRHENNIKGLAFLESHFKFGEEMNHSLPTLHLSSDLRQLKPVHAVERLLRSGTLRPLSRTELNMYLSSFSSARNCQPVLQYMNDLFGGDSSQAVASLIKTYSQKLMHSNLPKLMMYAVPGLNTTMDTVVWARDHINNLKLVDLGEDLHFIPETKPQLLGQHVATWYQSLK